MALYLAAMLELQVKMRDGIKIALNNTRKKYTNVKKIWADMGYQGGNLKNHIKKEYVIDIEIVKRPPCRFWVHKDIYTT